MIGALAAVPAQAQPATTATAVVREGYTNLLRTYVDPLPPDQLLTEAWNGAAAEAIVAGVDLLPALAPMPANREGAWAIFAAAFVELERAAEGRATSQQLAHAAIRAMTEARNECHTYFLSPERYAAFRSQLDGSERVVGIGVQISNSVPYTIVGVIAGAPAEQAGVQVGDIIIAVNGIPAAEQTYASLREQIRGAAGTAVTLTVLRPSADRLLDITIVRAAFSVPVLTSTLRPDGVGVLTLSVFATDGSSERLLREAVADLEARGAAGWVLDLRGNGGGAVTSVLSVLGIFLPDNTPAITWEGRSGGNLRLRVTGAEAAVQRPLAVLTGPASASGAEITAAVLQDTGRARVFGQRTMGCANGGSLTPLSDGSAMVITSARVLTGPSLRPLDGIGAQPDVEITPGAGDLALAAAIAHLLGQPATVAP